MGENDVIRITTTKERADAIFDALDHWIHGRDTRLMPDAPARVAYEEVTEALGQPERKRRYASTLRDMGYPAPQAPVQTDDGQRGEYTEDHPAYALIGVNRHTGGKQRLAGSDFIHNTRVVLTLKHARMYRSLSYDRWHGGHEIVEVSLSEAQWATLVSSFGIGDGVPCTLEFTAEDGLIPDIATTVDRRAQTSGEVGARLNAAVASLDALLADTKLTKVMRERIMQARQEIVSNVPFVLESADKHIEDTVEKAKVEVNAYVTGAVLRAGLTALGGEQPVVALLPDPTADRAPGELMEEWGK